MEKIINDVINAALNSVKPEVFLKKSISFKDGFLKINQNTYDSNDYAHIYVISIGKAGQTMAAVLSEILGEHISGGLILTKHIDFKIPVAPNFQIMTGGHPVPTQESILAAKRIVEFLKATTEKDLIIFLISGGGSSLLCLPEKGISLSEMQLCTRALLSCGANIQEINTLRKHLDQIKGGGLALKAAPSHMITLILSDVIGSPVDAIASGPTVPDPTTFQDALNILIKYNLQDKMPVSIFHTLEKGVLGKIPETLKPENPIAKLNNCFVLAENYTAARAAADTAEMNGYHSLILTESLAGEASVVGSNMAGILKELSRPDSKIKRPALIILGGETTVKLRGNGVGGRNEETALGAVKEMSNLQHCTLVTLATDGEDGCSEAAGAIVNGETYQRGIDLGLTPDDFLRKNDSRNYFYKLNDLIITGSSGTNVNDLTFLFLFSNND